MSYNIPEIIEIQLTQGQVALIDAIDADLTEFKWTAAKMSNGNYYAVRAVRIDKKQKRQWLHLVILKRMLDKEVPKGFMGDHKNGNTLNNTRDNLRIATRQQNSQNRKRSRNNVSGYKGVSWHRQKNKWQATIRIDGKNKFLGYFDNPQLAHEAYCKAAIGTHGNFARLE